MAKSYGENVETNLWQSILRCNAFNLDIASTQGSITHQKSQMLKLVDSRGARHLIAMCKELETCPR